MKEYFTADKVVFQLTINKISALKKGLPVKDCRLQLSVSKTFAAFLGPELI